MVEEGLSDDVTFEQKVEGSGGLGKLLLGGKAVGTGCKELRQQQEDQCG